jgi:hypothetical protein
MTDEPRNWRDVLEAGDELADIARQAAVDRVDVKVLLDAIHRWERVRREAMDD